MVFSTAIAKAPVILRPSGRIAVAVALTVFGLDTPITGAKYKVTFLLSVTIIAGSGR